MKPARTFTDKITRQPVTAAVNYLSICAVVNCREQLMQFQSFYETCTGNTLCEANYHVKRHKCKRCPAGQTAPAGADPSGENTDCVAAGGGH